VWAEYMNVASNSQFATIQFLPLMRGTVFFFK